MLFWQHFRAAMFFFVYFNTSSNWLTKHSGDNTAQLDNPDMLFIDDFKRQVTMTT